MCQPRQEHSEHCSDIKSCITLSEALGHIFSCWFCDNSENSRYTVTNSSWTRLRRIWLQIDIDMFYNHNPLEITVRYWVTNVRIRVVLATRNQSDCLNISPIRVCVSSAVHIPGHENIYSLYLPYHVWWSSSYRIFPFIHWYRSQTLNILPSVCLKV